MTSSKKVVGVTLVEFPNTPMGTPTNSTPIQLQVYTFGTGIQQVYFTATLRNTLPELSYYVDAPLKKLQDCSKAPEAYGLIADCAPATESPASAHNLTCPAGFGSWFEYECPRNFREAVCLGTLPTSTNRSTSSNGGATGAGAAAGLEIDAGCVRESFDSLSATCRCRLSDETGTDHPLARSVDRLFVKDLATSAYTFETAFEATNYIRDIPAVLQDNVVLSTTMVLGGLGFVLLLATLAIDFQESHSQAEKEKKKHGVYDPDSLVGSGRGPFDAEQGGAGAGVGVVEAALTENAVLEAAAATAAWDKHPGDITPEEQRVCLSFNSLFPSLKFNL